MRKPLTAAEQEALRELKEAREALEAAEMRLFLVARGAWPRRGAHLRPRVLVAGAEPQTRQAPWPL
jgi:hypothetical protein